MQGGRARELAKEEERLQKREEDSREKQAEEAEICSGSEILDGVGRMGIGWLVDRPNGRNGWVVTVQDSTRPPRQAEPCAHYSSDTDTDCWPQQAGTAGYITYIHFSAVARQAPTTPSAFCLSVSAALSLCLLPLSLFFLLLLSLPCASLPLLLLSPIVSSLQWSHPSVCSHRLPAHFSCVYTFNKLMTSLLTTAMPID